MRNPVYIYIYTIKCFQVLLIIHFWPTLKEFQVFLFNINNSSQHYSFVCSQSNGFKYCHVLLVIKLYSQLFTQS